MASFYSGEYLGMMNGGKVGVYVGLTFLRFLGHHICFFSDKNGYDKFQLLKSSLEKVGRQLLCIVQYACEYSSSCTGSQVQLELYWLASTARAVCEQVQLELLAVQLELCL